MSVELVLMTVTLTPYAITLLEVSLVSAMKDSVEMEKLVLVRENIMYVYSKVLSLLNVHACIQIFL